MSNRFMVGIGASAGGLEALTSFFSQMPNTTNASFVVVQHLSPDFKSLMDELLQKHTDMNIVMAKNGTSTEPNTIYLIPPRAYLTMVEGVLYVDEYQDETKLKMPIDAFFTSLAKDQKHKSIGIILSGTGSDGSRGIVDISKAGGLVIVQKPEDAAFDGMPKNAINTGVVDYVLKVDKMPSEITEYIDHPELSLQNQRLLDQQLKRVATIMNVYCGIDFRMYKNSTIGRRVERRMKVNKLQDLDDYIKRLIMSDKEKEVLKNDFLIGVTGFFRDVGAFGALSDALVYIKNNKDLRIWVAGCSTGEEAYSVAISLQEYIDKKQLKTSFKLFATDINQDAIDFANSGYYKDDLIDNIPQEIIDKYFERRHDGYKIMDVIRKKIVFAKHNLLTDPPFSNLDLLVCRNVLIYIKSEFQEKVIRNFYRSLKADGLLFLGGSESLGQLAEAFKTVEKKWNIFRKNIKYARKINEISMYSKMDYNYRKPGIRDVMTKGDIKRTRESILSNILDTLIDSAILVDNQDRIVEVYNDCSDYLHAQAGVFSNTVKSNMRKEITLLIHNIIRRLNKDESTVSYTNVSIKDGLYVTIKGDKIITKDEDYYLIQFIQPQTVSESYDANKIDYTEESNDRITQLENELSLTKENLQATVEELETSNEELQSSNEELIASNEELQSTNEELQSVNEELYSVNDEFQNKIEELTELNEDLNNLLINTDVAALYLDKDLRIRKKTPLISAITNIVDEDINRPINHITIMEGYPDMHEDIVTCSHTLKGLERQVEDDEGRTWYCKIKPYRKNKNIVEGIIITFVEITALVTQTTQLEDTNKLLDYVLEKTKLGWFRYHKKTDHFTTSKEMYCELGYTESEMPKTLQSFYKFIKKEDLPKLKKSIESLNKGKKDNLMMVVGFIQKDGSIINVRQSVEVIKDELFGTTLIIQAK